MIKGYFITGTDTGVGKTWATVALMRYFKKQGLSVIGMKPVAAGCNWHQGQLKNEDALLLQENATHYLPYEAINPYAFELPLSPHLAAEDNPVQINVILQAFDGLKDKADVILVEGAGGWFVPLNYQCDIADLAKALKLPIIMVVAIKLGCINHARLTYATLKASGTECAGWVAICLDQEITRQDEIIETINNKIDTPLLGVLPYSKEMDFDTLAGKFNLKH